MSLGKNTADGRLLEGYVSEIERVRAAKKELGDEEKAIFASATASNLSAARIRDVLKIRQMKPHDRQEAEAQLSMYLHAMGMDAETPLFRHVSLMKVDKTVKDEVIAAFKLLVPLHGEVVVAMGGGKVRLWRDKEGEAHAEDFVEPMPLPAGNPAQPQPRAKAEVPDVNDAGAKTLGEEAARENKPVISNPFPFGDERRPRWDEGWRKGSGSDGMGPDTSGKGDGKK